MRKEEFDQAIKDRKNTASRTLGFAALIIAVEAVTYAEVPAIPEPLRYGVAALAAAGVVFSLGNACVALNSVARLEDAALLNPGLIDPVPPQPSAQES